MKVQIFDSLGFEVKLGDLVQIQERRNGNLTFYSRVQIINGQLHPFFNFVYDRVVKVSQVPEDCKYSPAKDKMPEYWMHPNQELALIKEGDFNKWLMNALLYENNDFIKITE